MSTKLTLIAEGQPEPLGEIAGFLQDHGYMIQTVDSFHNALAEIPVRRPHVIILFMGRRPFKAEARQVCHFGKRTVGAAVVVIISSQNAEDRVMVLRAGADACLAWPVNLNELLARVEALLRRGRQHTEAETPPFIRGDLYVDFDTREVWMKGKRKDLTPKEFDLLVALIDCSRRQAIDDREVLRAVWPEAHGDRRLLRQYIWRLRQKIEPDPMTPEYIVHEPEFGYRLAD